MSLTLVCSSPGTDLRASLESLEASIRSVSRDVRREDVEDVLRGALEATDPELEALSNSEPFVQVRNSRPHQQWNMEVVTEELPRRLVIELWRGALQFALARLGDGGGRRLLSCHLTLYSYRSNEFYSPVAISAFPDNLVPSTVLILIDDVFDMFERLRQPGMVYESCETDYIRRSVKTDDLNEELNLICADQVQQEVNPADLQLCQRLRFEARTNTLQQLLAWRRADMVLGELIAAQWPDSRVAFIGTKQDRHALARWLREDQPIAYLSHPISRPRRDLREERTRNPDASWDAVPVVSQFNDLQFELGARDVFAVMPTAIDEFRLVRGDHPLSRRPLLDDRWPIPQHSDVLYRPPSASAPEYRELLHLGEVHDPPAVDGMLRSLEMSIRDEIAFRDHLLVAHTNHLIVFRPLYQKGDFSDGVLAEIQHWEALARSDGRRRSVFVHAPEDLTALEGFLAEEPRRTTFMALWGANTRDSHTDQHLLGFADAASPRSHHASSAGVARPRFLDPRPGTRERRPSPRSAAPPPSAAVSGSTAR
jgi:hypothetical protein